MSLAPGNAPASACFGLLDKLDALQLPATWALDERAGADFTDRLVATDDQEVALLCSRADLESQREGRSPASVLGRRLAAVGRAGRKVTTVVGAGWRDADDLELLVRHAVTAVRTTGVPKASWLRRLFATKKMASQPTALRWGLRQFSPSLMLPDSGGRMARRAIDAAARRQNSALLVINAVAVSQQPRALREAIDSLEHIAKHREDGTIDVVSIAEIVDRMDRAIRGRPTRSILRSSAA